MNWFITYRDGSKREVEIYKSGSKRIPMPPPDRPGEAMLGRLVTAGGLGRLVDFMMSPNQNFAILSAKRPEKSPEQNKADHEALKRRILEDGHGFYPADGFYKGVQEPSLFVPDVSLEEALSYGAMFEPKQESILYGGGGMYGFYAVDNGMFLGDVDAEDKPILSDVRKDFTILKEEEMDRLIKEKAQVGFTKVLRPKFEKRPFTTDPSMREIREEWKKETQPVPVKKDTIAGRDCVIITGQYALGHMCHINGTYKVESLKGNVVKFDNDLVCRLPLSMISAIFPI